MIQPVLSLLIASLGVQGTGNPFDLGPAGQGQRPPGGFGPGMQQEIKLLAKFDLDKNGWLNKEERAEARKSIPARAGGRGFGGPGGGMRNVTFTSGPRVSPKDVTNHAKAPLYDQQVVRTIFLDFENPEWESELAAFHNTDVEVPALMTVDGKTYKNVGVSFRGASSYMMVPAGGKRSFNISTDLADSKQRLMGFKTLNLLNSNGDPTMMSTVLYSTLATPYIKAPRANFVQVVVNSESWGVYVNVEQFNNDFVNTHFKDTLVKGKTGARWKVQGRPNGNSGLDYVGEDIAAYKSRYQIKSKDEDASWKKLIQLCKTLSETPIAELESALKPMLDIDGVLWFLAFDNAFANSDGYWVRASDYSIYLDPKGIFHIVPHDMNEAFRNGGGRRPMGAPGGPPPNGGPGGPPGPPMGGPGQGGPGGFRGGPGMMEGGSNLDLLVGMSDTRKPLRSRLLSVPSLRTKYLQYMRTIAEKSLNQTSIDNLVAKYRVLIEELVKADTRKLSTFEAFLDSTTPGSQLPQGARIGTNLSQFAQQRRTYILNYKPSEQR